MVALPRVGRDPQVLAVYARLPPSLPRHSLGSFAWFVAGMIGTGSERGLMLGGWVGANGATDSCSRGRD